MGILAGKPIAAADVGIFRWTQTGTQSVTFTTATSNTTAVVFPVAFSAAPAVMVNIDTAPGSTSLWRVRAISITTTGFNIFAEGPSNAWAAVPVSYVAVSRS